MAIPLCHIGTHTTILYVEAPRSTARRASFDTRAEGDQFKGGSALFDIIPLFRRSQLFIIPVIRQNAQMAGQNPTYESVRPSVYD